MVEATLKYGSFGLNPIDLLTKKFEELTRKLPDATQEGDEMRRL